MDLVEHTLFFLALSVPIVVLGAFYTEPDDAQAFRILPRRYLTFVGASALVAAVMLLLAALFV